MYLKATQALVKDGFVFHFLDSKIEKELQAGPSISHGSLIVKFHLFLLCGHSLGHSDVFETESWGLGEWSLQMEEDACSLVPLVHSLVHIVQFVYQRHR